MNERTTIRQENILMKLPTLFTTVVMINLNNFKGTGGGDGAGS